MIFPQNPDLDPLSLTLEEREELEAECRQEYEEIEALLPLKYSDWANNRYEFDNTMARYIAEGRYSDEIKARISVWTLFLWKLDQAWKGHRNFISIRLRLANLRSDMGEIKPTKILHPGFHPAVTGRPDNLSDALSQGIGTGDL